MSLHHPSLFLFFFFCSFLMISSDINAMSFLSNTSLTDGIDRIECSVADEKGNVYFGTFTAPGIVMKSDMKTLTNLGSVFLNRGEDFVSAIVYDFNNNIYASTYSSPTAHVVKIDTTTMSRIGKVSLPSRDLLLPADPDTIDGQLFKISAGVFLPSPQNTLVFSTDTEPTRLVNIPVSDFTYRESNVITLQNKENAAACFVLSKNYLLVGLQMAPAKIVYLNPTTLARQFTLSLDSSNGESYITTGFHMGALPMSGTVINPANVEAADTNIFYFLCYGSTTTPSTIVKISATSSPSPLLTKLETFKFTSPESRPRSVVPLPWMNQFVVGLSLWPGAVVTFDVSGGSMVKLWRTWISTADRYFSTAQLVTPYDIASTTTTTITTTTSSPSNSTTTTSSTTTSSNNNDNNENELKLIFATDSGAASAVQYIPSIRNFSTNIIHYTGGQSLVALGLHLGDHIFLAADVRPAIVIKMAGDTLQNIANLRLPLGDDWIRLFLIDKFGYGHVGLCTNIGRMVRFSTTTMTKLGHIDGDADEDCFHTGVWAPVLETDTKQVMYVTSFYGKNSAHSAYSSSIVKLEVTASGISLITRTTTSFPDRTFFGVVADPSATGGSYSVYGTFTSTGVVVKVNLQNGAVSDMAYLQSNEGPIRDVASVGEYSYFSVAPSYVTPGIVKMSSGTTAADKFSRVAKFNFGLAEPFYAIVPCAPPPGTSSTTTALLGTASEKILLVDLSNGNVHQTLSTGDILGAWEGGMAALPPPGSIATTAPPSSSSTTPKPTIAWMTTYSSPSWVLKIDTDVSSSNNNNAAPGLTLSTPVIAGASIAIFVLVGVIFILLVRKKGGSSSRYNNNNADNDNDQPMLQVPRTQITTFHHSAMSIPTREDMYSDRVAVPPPSNHNIRNNNVNNNSYQQRQYPYPPSSSTNRLEM